MVVELIPDPLWGVVGKKLSAARAVPKEFRRMPQPPGEEGQGQQRKGYQREQETVERCEEVLKQQLLKYDLQVENICTLDRYDDSVSNIRICASFFIGHLQLLECVSHISIIIYYFD